MEIIAYRYIQKEHSFIKKKKKKVFMIILLVSAPLLNTLYNENEILYLGKGTIVIMS